MILEEDQQTVNTCQGEQQSFFGGLKATIVNSIFGGKEDRANDTMMSMNPLNETINCTERESNILISPT